MSHTASGLERWICCRPCRNGWAAFAAFVLAGCVLPLYSLSLSQMPRPQRHDAHHAIDVLEESWRNAVLTSNANALSGLLADDYMAITPSGTLQNKDETLSSLRAGRFHVDSLTVSDRKVRFYGNTAVVTSLASVQATSSEGPLNGDFRYTRVYARDTQGRWRIVSFEASKVRPLGPGHHNEFH
jgi:ketosteroid isomerase-like protein